MRAHDGRVEHLNKMGRRAHRRERIEEGLEDVSLAQAIEAFPHAVPMTEALRQRPPANVLDGEEMKRLEEAAVVGALPSTPRQAGAEHRKRVRRSPTNHVRFTAGIPKARLAKIRPHGQGLLPKG